MAILAFFLIVSGISRAELPRQTQELIEKLEKYELKEREKLEEQIREKRDAVIALLITQAQEESDKGNADGVVSIRAKILELGGEPGEMEMPESNASKAASWEIPEDATLYRGDYYKVYPLARPVSWDEARALCKAVGGEIGWIDRNEDIAELRKWMQPVVDAKGHAPIWVGGRKNADGEWIWPDGDEVADNFWNNPSDAVSGPTEDAMIRWIGSFKAAGPESARVIGYLCRWKR